MQGHYPGKDFPHARPVLLQCVYQVMSENLKNMKLNTQIYSFENKSAGPEKKSIY